MQGDEIRTLRRLQREQGASSHVYMTERDGPMTPKAFHALFGRIGARAKMQFPIHPRRKRSDDVLGDAATARVADYDYWLR
jgi:hypothetical protein